MSDDDRQGPGSGDIYDGGDGNDVIDHFCPVVRLINLFLFLSRTVLIVKLIKGEEFPQYAGDSPNVFLELKLIPAMKKDILKTDIHERNANPNLNEVFEFGLPYDVVKKQNLNFTLMYMDKFSHPFPVGELTHHLDHLEMTGAGTAREEMIVCREIQRLQQVGAW